MFYFIFDKLKKKKIIIVNNKYNYNNNMKYNDN